MAGGSIVCIGGATVDRKLRLLSAFEPGTSNPVTSTPAIGGVARNVAENLARLSVPTTLVTVLGNDEAGRAVRASLDAVGIDTRFVRVLDACTTATYIAALTPEGDLAAGFADMAILDRLTPDLIETAANAIDAAAIVFCDCNAPRETLAALIDRARRPGLRLSIDAVSTAKVRRLPRDLDGIDVLFLNCDEAQALVGRSDEASRLARDLLARGAGRVVLTQGRDGLLAAERAGVTLIPALPCAAIDATGAGDALVAGTLAGLVAGEPLAVAAQRGTLAAALTVESALSVRPDLSEDRLAREAARRGARPAGDDR